MGKFFLVRQDLAEHAQIDVDLGGPRLLDAEVGLLELFRGHLHAAFRAVLLAVLVVAVLLLVFALCLAFLGFGGGCLAAHAQDVDGGGGPDEGNQANQQNLRKRGTPPAGKESRKQSAKSG